MYCISAATDIIIFGHYSDCYSCCFLYCIRPGRVSEPLASTSLTELRCVIGLIHRNQRAVRRRNIVEKVPATFGGRVREEEVDLSYGSLFISDQCGVMSDSL